MKLIPTSEHNGDEGRYKYFAIGRSGKGKFFTHEPFRLANGEWTRLGATVIGQRISESKEYVVDAKLLETADIPCDCTRFHIGRSSGR